MLFRQMGDSDKTPLKHNNGWNNIPSSSTTLPHSNQSWLPPPMPFSTYDAPPQQQQPQQPQRYNPVTSAYTSIPSYQAWSNMDYSQTEASHCMSAPTTPMNEDAPPHLSYIQGQQHPYAVSPTYATLTGRREQRNHETLHHQSSDQYDYDRQQPFHQQQQSWDHTYSIESPSSHEDHPFYPNQDDEYRKSSSASGMPIFNNTYYSPELGDETPSPISNSYPASNTDYLSYHHDQDAKHARRYSIGGGMITSAPHTTSIPSYPPYMKAYHYKVPLTERPYKCDKCPQSFNRNHDLKRHKRIHLSVKPFPCQTCDKQFSRKDALKRHILVKRCGQPLPPDGRRSSNHQNVSRSTSGVSNSRNKSGALDLTDQYANATMAPPY